MARDTYHEHVKNALIKDGWTITHDPLTLLPREEGGISTDLGAEKIITAEKGATRIAVEVKSFLKPSLIHEFLTASGQYGAYQIAIRMKNMERALYLAMPIFVHEKLQEYDFIREMIREQKIKIILYDPIAETIETWIE